LQIIIQMRESLSDDANNSNFLARPYEILQFVQHVVDLEVADDSSKSLRITRLDAGHHVHDEEEQPTDSDDEDRKIDNPEEFTTDSNGPTGILATALTLLLAILECKVAVL
jgi:hypothetical protein